MIVSYLFATVGFICFSIYVFKLGGYGESALWYQGAIFSILMGIWIGVLEIEQRLWEVKMEHEIKWTSN